MAKRKSKIWLYVLLGIVFLGLLAAAIYKNKQAPKGIAIQSTTVKKRTIIEKVGASGRIFPETEVKISSDVSGEVVQLYVAEGDSVKAGQLLAKVDPDIYISALERGKAGLNNAKSQAARARALIESNRAQLEQIKVQLNNAQTIYQRNKKLLDDGVISQAEFETAESGFRQLQANLRSAQAQLQSAEQSAKAADYTVKSSEASLKELRTNLRRTTILAPTAGIVSKLNVEKGERVVGTIQMAGTEMMRIANLSIMEAQVEVSENDILTISIGDSADIEVDAYLDNKFKGYVTEIAKSASNINPQGPLTSDQVTNFIVKIRIDPNSYKQLIRPNASYPFRPGMSTSVDIYTNRVDSVLAVPIQSVTVRDLNKKKKDKQENLKEVVFVIQSDSAHITPVELGIQDDDYIQIISGLQLHQKIVQGPYSVVSRKLKDKQRVTEKKKKSEKSDP